MKKYLLPYIISVLVLLLLISACGRNKTAGNDLTNQHSGSSVVDPAGPGINPVIPQDEDNNDPDNHSLENSEENESGEVVIGDDFVVPIGEDEGTGSL